MVGQFKDSRLTFRVGENHGVGVGGHADLEVFDWKLVVNTAAAVPDMNGLIGLAGDILPEVAIRGQNDLVIFKGL
jgi:hypothetical protein